MKPLICLCSAALLALAALTPAQSADLGPGRPIAAYPGGITLNCDNNRVYPLRVRSVTDAGEIVTGYLGVGYGQVHVRLAPMGNGYRYFGRGIWFDGKYDVAVLYFGLRHSVNCQVVRDGDSGVVVTRG
jgi:hypothetical protein